MATAMRHFLLPVLDSLPVVRLSSSVQGSSLTGALVVSSGGSEARAPGLVAAAIGAVPLAAITPRADVDSALAEVAVEAARVGAT